MYISQKNTLNGFGFVPFVFGLFAGVLYAFKNWRGIELSPDGWAFWQGAVSLTEGLGYSYFSGNPIVAWPPGYSGFLALAMSVFGPSSESLLFSNCVLVFLATAGWCFYCHLAAMSLGREQERRNLFFACLYVSLYMAYGGSVSSTLLAYTILPFFIISVWFSGNCWLWPKVLGVLLGTMLMLAHNMSIIFLAAASIAILSICKKLTRRVFLLLCVYLVLPIAFWVCVRLFLGQTGSHPLVGSSVPVWRFFYNALSGVALNLFPAPNLYAGLYAILICSLGVRVLLRNEFALRSQFLQIILIFASLPFLSLVLIFSSTYINGNLAESRFTLFVPLLLMPVLFLFVTSAKPILTVALSVALLNLGYQYVNRGFVVDVVNDVPLGAFLSRDLEPGQRETADGVLFVAPISWEEPLNGYSRDGRPKWGGNQETR